MKTTVWERLGSCGGVNVAVVVFSVALTALIWAVVIAEGRAERAGAIAAAVKQNSNLAIAYEEHVIRTLASLDAVARFTRHEYQETPDGIDLGAYIRDGIIDARLFTILSVVDARGNIVVSSNAVPPVNYADREHFSVHRRSDRDTLYISKPVLGRVSGTWQIPMSRRIDHADGTFAGIVVLSVDPAYFTDFYQKADLGHKGLVALVGLDGTARARRIGRVVDFGEDLSETTLLAQQARAASGSYFDTGAADGVPRYVSYRSLRHLPLIVAVGVAEDDVLAEPLSNSRRDYFTAIGVSVAIALFAGLLMLAMARQKRATLALAEDIAERKRLEAKLRALAVTDMLTGLPNRRHFIERVEEEHARLQRSATHDAAVLMLDLDDFKRINDTHGHAGGDAVLRHFAALLRHHIRHIDTVSRVGGEEFAVILPGARLPDALEFAERVRRAVAETPLVHDSAVLAVTVSIGVTEMRASDRSADAALLRSDAALYRAKARGRNRVEAAAV